MRVCLWYDLHGMYFAWNAFIFVEYIEIHTEILRYNLMTPNPEIQTLYII